MHKTNNIDDRYLASGKYISAAIKKYGRENFKKEILYRCSNDEEMRQLEKYLITEDFLKRPNVYNIRPGGRGGFTLEESHVAGRLAVRALALKKQQDPEFYEHLCKAISEGCKEAYRQGRPRNPKLTFKGRKHTEDSKRRAGQKISIHHTGAGNPQYGKIWIMNTKLQKSIRIQKEMFQHYLDDGWILGRKLKWK